MGFNTVLMAVRISVLSSITGLTVYEAAYDEYEEEMDETIYLVGHLTASENGRLIQDTTWVREGLFIANSSGSTLPSSSVNDMNGYCGPIEWVEDCMEWKNKLLGQLFTNYVHNLYEHNSLVGLLQARAYLQSQVFPASDFRSQFVFLKLGEIDRFCHYSGQSANGQHVDPPEHHDLFKQGLTEAGVDDEVEE